MALLKLNWEVLKLQEVTLLVWRTFLHHASSNWAQGRDKRDAMCYPHYCMLQSRGQSTRKWKIKYKHMRCGHIGECWDCHIQRGKQRSYTNSWRLDHFLKMDYNDNSHIKLTIEPCLCCVQVTIYCCGHVFLFIILLQFDRKKWDPASSIFLKFPALHWFPTKTHWKSHY